jgi:hypothetical protein
MKRYRTGGASESEIEGGANFDGREVAVEQEKECDREEEEGGTYDGV